MTEIKKDELVDFGGEDEQDGSCIALVHEETGVKVLMRMEPEQLSNGETVFVGQFFFTDADDTRLSQAEKEKIIDDINADFDEFVEQLEDGNYGA